jgi:hypothetical protein
MQSQNIPTGIYEQIINRLIQLKLNKVDTNRFYIGKKQIDKDEAVNKIHNCRKSELFCLLVNTK